MSNKRIVICDDEASIRQLVKIFLVRYQFDVIEVGTGQELLDLFANDEHIDLVILDLMLPDMYGIDVCKKIRETSMVPVIMLTAVQGEMNTVLEFEAGADDYIEKPFSAHVLLSRIQAIFKRVSHPGAAVANAEEEIASVPTSYKKAIFGQWTYLIDEGCIRHHTGKHVFLTKNDCLLLELFLSKEQEILTREKIAKCLDIDIDDVESRAIDVQISRLRNKLKDKTQSNFIKSIRNKGYLFSVPVKFVD